MSNPPCVLFPFSSLSFVFAGLAQTLTVQNSGTASALRGVSAVNDQVVWASGTKGTYLRTVDGGTHWTAAVVPGAESLDFRDVQGVDADTAYLLSIGKGATSRIYKTTDGGAHWTLSLQNADAEGFFDEMAFWNPRHGILVGDQVDGQMVVMTTEDGGATWQRVKMPPALPGEGAFAASGTGITVLGDRDVWIGTGGKNAARVYHSADAGRTWSVASTPIRADGDDAGIFSVAFSDARHGIAVGGSYRKFNETAGNIAVTVGWRHYVDGARRALHRPASGRRSRTWVAISGSPRARRAPTFRLMAARTGSSSTKGITTRSVFRDALGGQWGRKA